MTDPKTSDDIKLGRVLGGVLHTAQARRKPGLPRDAWSAWSDLMHVAQTFAWLARIAPTRSPMVSRNATDPDAAKECLRVLETVFIEGPRGIAVAPLLAIAQAAAAVIEGASS